MIRLYNTMTREKEEFIPVEPNKVKMYVCGLTVQNYSHVGHIRSAVNYDVIRKYLEYKGYQVEYISNFTDINEKIVARAEEENMTPTELAQKYEAAFLDDIAAMNIRPADQYLRVSENIEDIIEMVKVLIDKEYAYVAEGNVYFSVESFADYGKLSGRNIEDMQAGARVDILEDKKHPMDFALWKKVNNEEFSWDSPWGKGWPGWHIECSAMAMKRLGTTFDIHGGGTDLIFPHHENEIAQSEAYSGEVFAKYWLHNGTVNLSGEKMSKSQGNFFTTREVLKKFPAEVIRFFLLTRHYRSPIDFSIPQLKEATVSLERLIKTADQMESLLADNPEDKQNNLATTDVFIAMLKEKRKSFEEAMDDDFNTAKAIGILHELAGEINKFINQQSFKLNENKYFLLTEANKLYRKLANVLGLKLELKDGTKNYSSVFADLMELVLELRQEAREEKEWEKADLIRDRLDEVGIEVKDTPRGTEWNLKKRDE